MIMIMMLLMILSVILQWHMRIMTTLLLLMKGLGDTEEKRP